jgi:signal transduction histidine kinase
MRDRTIYHGGARRMSSRTLDARLAPLADAVSQGVAVVRDGCIAWANERLAEMSGREDALRGLKVADLLEDTGDGLPGADAPRALECALARNDSEARILACRLALEDTGEGAVWILEDVSHVRRLESELLRMGKALAAANREVESLRERLRSERAEREELLSIVSHELRTPVTVISGYNRLLLSGEVGPLTEDQRRFLEESGKSCRRLDSFIGNLLEASGVEKGDVVLEIGRAALAPVLESVAEMFRPLLAERSLSLEIDVEPDAERARFDRLRVEQVLTNLLGNAVKYAAPDGRVEIATRAVPGFVEVSVSDDGPGVPEADRERIFEPYVQAGEESRAGGLGLGLAISRRLVEAHGGSLRYEDRPAGGSSFVFTLPADVPAES